MGKDVIIACDFSSKEDTLSFLSKFTGKKPFVKIGMELFYAEGPAIVHELKTRGHKIFLDLKLHDIPNTVKKSMSVLSKLDVDMTNLHASGTISMMEAALEAGAEDFQAEEDGFAIITAPNDFAAVREALEGKYEFVQADITMLPNMYTALDPALQKQMDKLMDQLEEDDDVQNVWTNMQM